MTKFVIALNMIGSQPWAAFMLLCGIVTLVYSKKYGLDTTISGGIIGAATNMFTGSLSRSLKHEDGSTSQEVSNPGGTIKL